jgi:hypothetical protein
MTVGPFSMSISAMQWTTVVLGVSQRVDDLERTPDATACTGDDRHVVHQPAG